MLTGYHFYRYFLKFSFIVPPAKHSDTKGSLCPESARPSVCPSFTLEVLQAINFDMSEIRLNYL